MTNALLVASIATRMNQTWPWYVVRVAGFTAAALLIALVLSGIGQATGITYRWISPIKAWALHKALAFSLIAAIAIHILFLLVDHYISFTIVQILVPFVSTYSNKTSLFGASMVAFAVSFGIFAAYGIALIVASSLGWIDSRKTTWRWLYYLSYIVFGLVVLHGLTAGSDLKYGTFRLGWIGLGLIMGAALLARLFRSGSLKN